MEELTNRLAAIFGPLVKPEEDQIKCALETLKPDRGELEPLLLQPDTLPYGRHVLYCTKDVEVVLIHLPAGVRSLPHDHGESFGYEIVVEGVLTNLIYQVDAHGSLRLEREEVCPEKSIVRIAKDQIHAIANTGNGRVISLNVYAPPLAACKQYSLYAL